MTWISPNVFRQGPDQPLSSIPRFDPIAKNLRFRHIIHVYDDKELPENTALQFVTFDTVNDAVILCKSALDVACVAITYPDDAHLVPEHITLGPPLTRYACDIIDVSKRRPLPLLYDIIDLGLSAPLEKNAAEEFVILTNSDIHVQPNFYRFAAEIIGMGYDVATVNRRTIEVDQHDRRNRALYSVDAGKPHPGFDCFIFPVSLYSRFVKTNSCCGAGLVMRSLLFNLVSTCQRFLMVTGAHATYHLGDDRKWQVSEFAEYEESNAREAQRVLDHFGRSAIASSNLRPFVASHEAANFADYLDRVPIAS
ncbi:hypothetical protein [Sphingobium sp. GW456-12-10-14-TSB1]|uniref:hypothetical protein n=1 Tax=Sphingobium sp. GW456-12-10-14-TSB1 TaxID=1987165 RepID=UPI00111D9ECB|nr:hypothetical protein [Sphingobium sp. GW456-12-10-14-TSB1]